MHHNADSSVVGVDATDPITSRSTAIARIVTASSIALTAAASGITMLLFLGRFGTQSSTDGILAAYSVYVLVTVFAQGCRITAGAAVAGDAPRITTSELAWALVTAGGALAVVLVGARAPIAEVLSGHSSSISASSDAARRAASGALPIFAVGVFAQFASVAWSVVLGERGRVAFASGSLAVGGVAALIAFVLLAPSSGVDALAWSTVVAGATACAVLMFGAAPRPRGATPARVRFALRLLVVENLVPLFSTIVYLVALAVASNLPAGSLGASPGVVSQFALAFLACSYLCGILGLSSAIVDTAHGGNGSTATVAGRIEETVEPALRIVFPLAAASLLVGALLAPRVLEIIGPDSASGDPRFIGLLLLALVPFTFATLAGNVAFSCWYNARQVTHLNRGALIALPLHAGVSVALGLLFGIAGVALATGLTASAFTWWTLRPAPRTAARVFARGAMLVAGVGVLIAAGAALGAWSGGWHHFGDAGAAFASTGR